MRRLLAILALVAVLPGLVWAQSINQSDTKTSTIITFTLDDSITPGVWNRSTNACATFRATWQRGGLAAVDLHAAASPTDVGAATLIRSFTTDESEPGTVLNATGRYFFLDVQTASTGTSRLVLRCSNAQVN